MKLSFSTAHLLAALAATATSTKALPAFQSGPYEDSAYYAAGLVAHPTTGELYVTGIAYDDNDYSQCLVATLDDTMVGGFTTLKIYDNTNIDTACRSLALLSDQQVVVVGTSDPGGILYDDQGTTGTLNTATVQVGFGMTAAKNDLSWISGSSLFSQTQVPYPQAVVVDPDDPDTLFVASMTSTAGSGENTLTSASDYPNWTHEFKYGKAFEMTIEQLSYTTQGSGSTFDGILDGQGVNASPPKLQQVWAQHFPVENAKSVYVGGMIWKSGVGLIVAGSTAGQGLGYGNSVGDDEDGYISILDPQTGALVSGRKNNQRFGTGDYDFVTSVCHDPNDDTSFYLVGATKGDMRDDDLDNNDIQIPAGSQQAFLMKVNVDSLNGEWTVQEAAYLRSSPTTMTQSSAWGCAVYQDYVYMTGIVDGGAGMVETSVASGATTTHASSGGDDIWIAQYAVADGVLQWMQQVGSTGDDHVARNGAIAIDPKGNAVVVGDTTGALYRTRTGLTSTDGTSDIFVMTFAQADGSYEPTIQGDVQDDKEPMPNDEGNDPDDEDEDDDGTFGTVDTEDLPTEAALAASSQAHQSGPNAGALYASALVYDAASDQAVITGISYTSSNGRTTEQPGCLMARIEIGSMQTKQYNILGTESVLEACRGIAMPSTGTDLLSMDLVVVGNSEAGGLYADQRHVQTGFGFTVSGNDMSVKEGASLFQLSNTIPYPQAVVLDGNAVYVASMTSNDVNQNTNSQVGTDFPNWTYLNKYGQGFTMTVEKLTLPNFDSVWSQTYPVEQEIDGSIYSVHVGGLLLKNDELIVVGSTRAKGLAYGPAEGPDSDGYITVLDPSTGFLVQGTRNNARIGSSADDVIAEICDVPGDDKSIIVVGATKGNVGGIRDQGAASLVPQDSLQWFAKKISLTDLAEVWTIQGGAVGGTNKGATSAFAVGCHVNDNIVYVGGTVENGAELLDGNNRKDSMGGNDVFVASLSLNDGSTNWLRQFGSVGDDQLARNGGIVTDKDGDVLIYGDTTGALYRERSVSSNADIFLAVLRASDGTMEVKGTSAPGSGPAATIPVAQPTPAPVAPPTQKEDTNDYGVTIPDDIVALQLGPDVGPSYAGGMDYDPEANSLYLTGATYGAFSGPGVRPTKKSSCFFSRLDLPELEVIQRDTYGVDMSPDSCTAIAANSDGNGRNAILVGSTEAGGLLTELSDLKAKQYGFAMDLSLQHKFEFLGGSAVGKDPVTFPVAVVAEEENFWTVSMTSSSDKVSPDFDKVKDNKYPNFTNGGVMKYGTNFNINVESFKVFRTGDGNPFAQGAAKNFISEWSQDITPMDHDGMLLTGMITAQDNVIVVGAVHHDGIMDGFIVKITKESGRLNPNGNNGKAVQYISADETSDDWIMNACVDPTDQDFFFIVGASQGKSTGKSDNKQRKKNEAPVHAIVAKINTVTLETEWRKQFNAEDSAKIAAAAYGCDVVSIENTLYVAGTVEDGARMVQAEENPGVSAQSAGGDDIFVAQLSTTDGRLNWLRQVGSNGDDRIARGGGIRADTNGNAIVYGDTTGDFFRYRQVGTDSNLRHTDPFVMMFDKHYGIHQPPLRGPKITTSNNPTEFFNDFTKNQKKGARIFGIIVLVVFLLVVMFFAYRRCCRRSEKEIPSIYDAAAADLGYEDDLGTASLSSGGPGSRSTGLGFFKDNPADQGRHAGGPNLAYRDDVDFAEDGAASGNFHKTYSDLPQNGKEII